MISFENVEAHYQNEAVQIRSSGLMKFSGITQGASGPKYPSNYYTVSAPPGTYLCPEASSDKDGTPEFATQGLPTFRG